jgi:hypothetical protein
MISGLRLAGFTPRGEERGHAAHEVQYLGDGSLSHFRRERAASIYIPASAWVEQVCEESGATQIFVRYKVHSGAPKVEPTSATAG